MYQLIKKYLLSLYFVADDLLHTVRDKQQKERQLRDTVICWHQVKLYYLPKSLNSLNIFSRHVLLILVSTYQIASTGQSQDSSLGLTLKLVLFLQRICLPGLSLCLYGIYSSVGELGLVHRKFCQRSWAVIFRRSAPPCQ